MNKTIKVIELLNKIANGEEIPNKIKYHDIVYTYKVLTIGKGYVNFEYEPCCSWFENEIADNKEDLNQEVEIIEEPNEIDIQGIEELLTIEDYEFDKTDGRLNRDKINELVRAVKQLDRKYKGE